MKKTISIILAVLIIVFSVSFESAAAPKQPLPVSAGIEALRNQFETATAPEVNDYSLDYEFYSPVGENDTTKYPLVIFLHGIGHGEYEGSQVDDSEMPYWSSAELQARFSDGGAFIILPRAPEENNVFWGESFIEPLRALIDDFIEQHKDNVDTTRISISGSSQGGAMVWMMLEAYPEYFATAFPLASTKTPSKKLIKASSSTAVWILASKFDPIINYNLSTLSIWHKICKYNKHPENCRLSTFGTVYNPDGTKSSDNHHLAKVITYDLHTLDNGLYPEMITEDGFGNDVDTAAPNGLIQWISTVHSDFTGNTDSPVQKVTCWDRIVQYFRNKMLQFVHIIQVMLGL